MRSDFKRMSKRSWCTIRYFGSGDPTSGCLIGYHLAHISNLPTPNLQTWPDWARHQERRENFSESPEFSTIQQEGEGRRLQSNLFCGVIGKTCARAQCARLGSRVVPNYVPLVSARSPSQFDGPSPPLLEQLGRRNFVALVFNFSIHQKHSYEFGAKG